MKDYDGGGNTQGTEDPNRTDGEDVLVTRERQLRAQAPSGEQASARRRQEEARRRRLRQLTIATLVVVVAAVVLAVAATRNENGGPNGAGEALLELEGQPALGSPDAPVTVVEFSDFKCPYCREFTLEVFPRLKEEYIDTGKVRFYFINYPFLAADSEVAAMAAEAVFAQDPEGVWPFIDAVMRQQGPKDEAWATPEFLTGVAAEAVPGLDRDRFLAALKEEQFRDEIERDRRIGERAGVEGVPSVFVNGQLVEDWSYEGLKAAIDQALAAAGASEGASR